MATKYELPPFLEGMFERQIYVQWLHRKAQAHARRDRRRWSRAIRASHYKQAIHHAVHGFRSGFPVCCGDPC